MCPDSMCPDFCMSRLLCFAQKHRNSMYPDFYVSRLLCFAQKRHFILTTPPFFLNCSVPFCKQWFAWSKTYDGSNALPAMRVSK